MTDNRNYDDIPVTMNRATYNELLECRIKIELMREFFKDGDYIRSDDLRIFLGIPKAVEE